MSVERTSKPVLFMANHPVMFRTFAGILELNKERENLVVACDALYSNILGKFGVQVLGIDSPQKTLWTHKRVYRARTMLTRMFGQLTHAYDDALKGGEVIEAMVDTLRSGNDLFITPAGVSDPDARWRSGVGRLAVEIAEEPISTGFVYIPNSFLKPSVVYYGPTIGSLIPKEGSYHPREVALQLQQEYQKRVFEN